MNYKQLFLSALVGAVSALLVFFIAGLFGSASLGAIGPGPTHFQKENFIQGLSVGRTGQFEVQNDGVVSSSAAFRTNGALSVSGNFTGATADFSGELEASLVEEGSLATLTQTSTVTISAAQLCDNNVLSFNFGRNQGSSTLPSASSTVADCLTTDGDVLTLFLRNTSSTSYFTLIAGDASTTLVSATSTLTTTGANVQQSTMSRLQVVRIGADTLFAIIEPLRDAD